MALKTFDIDGIKVKINPLIFEDYRFVSLTAKSSKTNKLMEQAKEGDKEKLAATLGEYTVTLIEMVLGDNLEHVEDELAARNDGFVSIEAMGKFYEELIKAAQPKK